METPSPLAGEGQGEGEKPGFRMKTIKGSVIDQTSSYEISPSPSLSKRGIPPFGKGREGGI